MKKKVLFVCEFNSARSQMAETFLKAIAEDRFEVESAGITPGTLNPLAVEVMKEIGIDISKNKTQGVFDLYKAGKRYHYIITVCDKENRCPVFPNTLQTLHWSLDDPADFEGSYEEKLKKMRHLRDKIKQKIEEWVKII
ncbi:MAG: arsenate reductase ArsC [Candidatus Ratteibacteria bacterium]|nr:arsenate reductase ArsC [Candidatus Ratteibacteria bacterium]